MKENSNRFTLDYAHHFVENNYITIFNNLVLLFSSSSSNRVANANIGLKSCVRKLHKIKADAGKHIY